MNNSVASDVTDPLTRHLDEALAGCLLPHPPEHIGVAVSGGSDSLALLCLIHRFARSRPVKVHPVTIDHGLREGSAEEALQVRALCDALGLDHAILRWDNWDRKGNLQNEARDARYRLMTDWAASKGIHTVALGHTQDDQAETVLLRLARGAGVDGLSAMLPRRRSGGIEWIRPLLDLRRQDLRTYLQGAGIRWADDPSNTDTRFERVKVRQAMQHLEPLGIAIPQLAQVARNMARSRDALKWQTFLNAREIARIIAGSVVIEWKPYRTLPDEIARRLLVASIGWVSGSTYPPRSASVLDVINALKRDTAATLDGCHLRRIDGAIWVFREYQAVRNTVSSVDEVWDGRWIFHPSDGTDLNLTVQALGDTGLQNCPDWRATGWPRDVLRSAPGVWRGDELVAAPVAKNCQGWRCELTNGEEGFFAALLSH